jgi:hypothetical protein
LDAKRFLTNTVAVLTALARLYFDIAIWRRGPQHVPAVGILLPFTIAVYVLVNALLSGLAPGVRVHWPAQLATDVLFMSVWYWLLLALMRRRERFTQMAAAIFGYQTVLAPLFALDGALMQRFGSEGALSLGAYVLSFTLLVWTVVALAHILRAALERPLGLCLALAFTQVVAEEWLLYLLFDPRT